VSEVRVVGVGPGDCRLLTPQAAESIREAEVIIAYAGYFPLVDELVQGKECLALELGQEVERAERAVQMALQGRRVCVVSSGDPGIYGMASLVLEIAAARDPHKQVDITVVPGVSAINAAAALLGAPLGHDFAVISLSDLLTPWTAIERRLQAAGSADFVTVLVNPRSRRRDWQLSRAREVLLQHRAPATPAGIVRQAYRAEQQVTQTTLAELPVTEIDMFCTIIVGNSMTRRLGEAIVTPRGYDAGKESV
jgi:precorrin-3B C17-methyltransferase